MPLIRENASQQQWSCDVLYADRVFSWILKKKCTKTFYTSVEIVKWKDNTLYNPVTFVYDQIDRRTTSKEKEVNFNSPQLILLAGISQNLEFSCIFCWSWKHKSHCNTNGVEIHGPIRWWYIVNHSGKMNEVWKSHMEI